MDTDEAELKRRELVLVNECDGIQPITEVFYIYSVYYSADRALAALNRFWTAYETTKDNSEIVSSAQEALTHSAALSRFFWPSPGNKLAKLKEARAARLRKSFSIDDTFELRNRNLRNALEHFDERLDLFLLKNIAGEMFPTPIVAHHEYAHNETQKFFRLVDPEQMVFVLFGEKFSFGQIMAEVDHIFLRAKQMTESQCLA